MQLYSHHQNSNQFSILPIYCSCDSTSNVGLFSRNSIPTFRDELSLPLLPKTTLLAQRIQTLDLQIGHSEFFKSHLSTHLA
jgi:hypothetical protein